mgnify:CR=1 FL=1
MLRNKLPKDGQRASLLRRCFVRSIGISVYGVWSARSTTDVLSMSEPRGHMDHLEVPLFSGQWGATLYFDQNPKYSRGRRTRVSGIVWTRLTSDVSESPSDE